MTDTSKFHERIKYFVVRRHHPDPATAKRAQENLDWWLDKYAAHLKAAEKAKGETETEVADA